MLQCAAVHSDADSCSPLAFHLQLEREAAVLDTLHVPAGVRQLGDPAVGDDCVAIFEGEWFRGRVSALAEEGEKDVSGLEIINAIYSRLYFSSTTATKSARSPSTSTRPTATWSHC